MIEDTTERAARVLINGGGGNHATNQRIPAALAAGLTIVGLVEPKNRQGAERAADWIVESAAREGRAWGYPVPDIARTRPALFNDLTEVPESLGVDLVIDAGPSPTHFETVKYCVGARGWAVNVEKPATMNAQQADELDRIVTADGPAVTVGYMLAWQLADARSEIVTERKIGPVTHVDWEWHRLEMYRLPPHFFSKPRTGVGPDLLGHGLVPIERFLDSRPVEVIWASGSRAAGVKEFGPEFAGYDTIEAMIRFANNATAKVRVTWGDGRERPEFLQDNNEGARFVLTGKEGNAVYHGIVPQGHAYPDPRRFRGEITTAAGAVEPGATPRNYQDSIVAQTKNAADAAIAKDPTRLELPLRVALDAELTIGAIHSAIETGSPVPILY